MRKGRAFDVVVVGAGVTGLAAARALKAAGVARVALCEASPDARQPDAAPPGSVTAVAAGLALGGQVDNFTRVSHALGAEAGAALWRFGDAAFDALASWCEGAGVPFRRGRRVRLITSPTELTEAEQAVRELQAAGLGSTLVARAAHPLAPLLGERVLAVQDDGPRAGWVDVPALLARLAAATAEVPRLPAALRIESGGATLALDLAGGETVTAELAIVAAHLGTKVLVPQLADALVSVADEWSEVAVTLPPEAAALTGFCWSANHTYEWGGFPPGGDRVAVGGGRYLRPLAGFEATTATREPKILTHLTQQLAKTFPFAAGARPTATRCGLDIRPCDERPVIGPVGGEGRILVAAGYGGAGLTLGFLAGECLAELVASGRSDRLPRNLSPERLRSLES